MMLRSCGAGIFWYGPLLAAIQYLDVIGIKESSSSVYSSDSSVEEVWQAYIGGFLGQRE